jgi:chromosomal replication initiator protein
MVTPSRSTSGRCHPHTDEGLVAPSTEAKKSLPRRKTRNWNGLILLPENRSAVRAVRSLLRVVLAGKRPQICPLVLHGSPGTGKTLLAAAAVKDIAREAHGLTARFVSAADLARPDEDDGFADRDLQSCDFLVVEDVQHLPNRFADAACDLIDHRIARRKPIVISSSTGPAGLRHLSRRLTSRLSAGLVVQLETLGVRSRRTILDAAARANQTRLAPEVLGWLARQGEGMRAALGSLQNLSQLARDFSGPLDPTAAAQILGESTLPTSNYCDPQRIIQRVAAAFFASEKDLLGTSRLRTALLPRQVAMYLTRELTQLSLPRIGELFSGRDHTTVLHACRKVEVELEENQKLAAIVRQLKSELC